MNAGLTEVTVKSYLYLECELYEQPHFQFWTYRMVERPSRMFIAEHEFKAPIPDVADPLPMLTAIIRRKKQQVIDKLDAQLEGVEA